MYEKIPDEMKQRDQWVIWKRERRGGAETKVPYNAKAPNQHAKVSDPMTWATFEAAVQAADDDGIAGIGFVFSKEDPFCGIDLDKCRDEHTGEFTEAARSIIDRFASYTEISPSETGAHVLLKGKLPAGGRRKGGVELYDSDRYFCMGRHLDGTPTFIAEQQDELALLHTELFGGGKQNGAPQNGSLPTPAPVPPAAPVAVAHPAAKLSDEELVSLVPLLKQGEKLLPLLEGDWGGYRSQSEADLALAIGFRALAGDDAARIDRLFRSSALYRIKWDERRGAATYGARTIDAALRADLHPEATILGVGQGEADEDSQGEITLPRPPQPPVVTLLESIGDVELFHTPERQTFARVPVSGHFENYALNGQEFKLWLSAAWFREFQTVPSEHAYKDALGWLNGKALFDGEKRQVWVRIAEHEGSVYIDLGNPEWNAVEITPSGWSVIADPPVRFHRPNTLRPLPTPETGGCLDDLRPFLNLDSNDDQQWRLIVGWLIGALRPQGPYLVLLLQGEQGSAKSTTARMLRALVDPCQAPLRRMPATERDLMITASRSWMTVLDNISTMKEWHSDALCCLSTGAGFATRQLFTDTEEVVFEVARPILINGISDLAQRGDLLDRSVEVTLPRLDDSRRKDEAELWASFNAAVPKLLGALYSVVSRALHDFASTKLSSMPRMADATRWVTAGAPALGWTTEEFAEAYATNRMDSNIAILDGSPILAPLQRFLKRHSTGWTGTASELLHELTQRAGLSGKGAGWPKDPRSLSIQLRRLAPNLIRAGYVVEFNRTRKRREIHLEPPTSSAASPASSSQVTGRDANDNTVTEDAAPASLKEPAEGDGRDDVDGLDEDRWDLNAGHNPWLEDGEQLS